MIGRRGRPRAVGDDCPDLDPTRLVFLDERGRHQLLRRYGRSLRGQRVPNAPQGRWESNLHRARVNHRAGVLDGPMDGASFLAYVNRSSYRRCSPVTW